MTYSDPSNFVGGTDGVATTTNVKEANLQHVIVYDNLGNAYDYIVVEGVGGTTELYTIAGDGTLTLQQTLSVGTSEAQFYDAFTVINDSDSNATYLFDTDTGGSNVLSWDPATATWTSTSQANTEFFGNGAVKMDVFQADDGTIYGYAGSTGTTGTDVINQYIFDENSKTFVLDSSYTPTVDLGKTLGAFASTMETFEMQVLMTNDGPKLLQWNDGGVERVEGFTLYDIDPATGDLVAGSASSYTFATEAAQSAFGVDAEITTPDDLLNEKLEGGQTSEIIVDANGNIVILNGSWGTAETSATGMIVIDPSLGLPDSADALQDGDGDLDNSASVLAVYWENGSTSTNNGTVPAEAWGSNPDVSYSPDGAYMYITSENSYDSLDNQNTATIVVSMADYSIVDWSYDTTSGYYSTDPTNDGATTAHTGGMSQILVTLSSGEQYYLDQYSDTSNSTSGWLAVSDVTASIVTTAPVCFCRGSEILTREGYVKIENLAAGDMVWTKDNGYKPIAWIGRSIRTNDGSATIEKVSPIRIAAGALGKNSPAQDLYVSPQHRILVRSRIAERLTGNTEVLVAAVHLLDLDGVERVSDFDMVEYYHMLFDQHEIVCANGVETESLHTGAQALQSISHAALEEIMALFPELTQPELAESGKLARATPNGKIARKLAQRHKKNAVPLQTEPAP